MGEFQELQPIEGLEISAISADLYGDGRDDLALFYFKEGAKKASPVLLEPGMKVEAVTPGDYLGDVTGDLNRRRGIIQGMEETVVGNIIKAEVPLSEMFGYATDLRSMTQGRATYTMEFEKYAEIPSNIAEELIQKAS